jgi:anti-anti-sigma regulatory factor
MEKDITIIFPQINFEDLIKDIDNESKIKIQNFYNQIQSLIDKKYNLISIDCKNLTTINSSILAKFLYFQKKYKKSGLKIRFFNLNTNIKKILTSLGFADFFIID